MEIHQALTRSDRIQNILCRHEQVRPSAGARPHSPWVLPLWSPLSSRSAEVGP
jgi:hypothetical protein